MTHTFGGSWTTLKLDVMERYFGSFAIALKNMPFACWYVDAFAGTGERSDSRRENAQALGNLFGEEASDVSEAKDGSVRLALKIEPPFRRYIFIDRSLDHVAHLKAYEAEFPDRAIDVRPGDANERLLELCHSTNWERTRAAVFIDPYGMQVNWSTLEKLAKTKADIALLFPTGSLNRLLKRDGDIPSEWAARIDAHLGECEWRAAFYRPVVRTDLFDTLSSSQSNEKTVNTDQLRDFVRDRLASIFAYVHPQSVTLRNSKGSALYDLFIMCANTSEKAHALAKKLANGAINASKKQKL